MDNSQKKKLCDLEREQNGTEETWFDPHDWTLQTQSERELTDNEFSSTDDEGSDDQRLKRQSFAGEKKGVQNRESDMKMQVRNRLHSPIGSAEAA